MRKMKTTCGLYKFLVEQGAFDKGKEYIEWAKKEYRRKYLREHKRSYRKRKVQHTVTLANTEEKRLLAEAKSYGMGVATFIRLAALSYVSKKYLTPRLEAIHRVQQEIVIARTQIERIRQERKSLFGASRDEKIEALLLSIEGIIRTSFHEPADLEALVDEARKHNPELLGRLSVIIHRA